MDRFEDEPIGVVECGISEMFGKLNLKSLSHPIAERPGAEVHHGKLSKPQNASSLLDLPHKLNRQTQG